jgi:hypothetical protein
MTSEAFILGGPISEKVAIGARIREYAKTLGLGHVDAVAENPGNRVAVREAWACPSTAREYDIRRDLERHLNK